MGSIATTIADMMKKETWEEWKQWRYVLGDGKMKRLYGNVWYHWGAADSMGMGVHPQYYMYEEKAYQDGTIALLFNHFHKNSKGAPFATRAYIIAEKDIYSYCDGCKKKFPSRKKLETMVGLKELTE